MCNPCDCVVIASLRHFFIASLRCRCIIALSLRHCIFDASFLPLRCHCVIASFWHCCVIASRRCHCGIALSLRHFFLSLSCHCVLPLLVRYCVIIASSFHCVVISSLRQFVIAFSLCSDAFYAVIALRLGSPRAHFTQWVAEAGQNQRGRTEKSVAKMLVEVVPGGAFAFLLRNTPIYRAALRAAGGQ